ncbi:hypothetical protein PHLGIDRAFT_288555 [Phlebiopsis gigantea 11061_1 CR5-6]|uniref:Uncharacterized protein n=1 Tax=Phlebiopsis gigantea (strain 11061_1 CR5-6) TaxID=745531 RepID=A0A0C3SBB6_PHLG1|nr:hypothetical protein PHLGIDRAFT_288555 [Phlebiopsis gigantea 11061_1 CR5-6]
MQAGGLVDIPVRFLSYADHTATIATQVIVYLILVLQKELNARDVTSDDATSVGGRVPILESRTSICAGVGEISWQGSMAYIVRMQNHAEDVTGSGALSRGRRYH